jgi:hypothetical protein
MAITLPLTAGNTGTNDWSDVYNNDAQLVTEIDDRDGNYQHLLQGHGNLVNDASAGTYFFYWLNLMVGSGSAANTATATGSVTVPLVYFTASDYAITSKTQKLRLRAQVVSNATAPGITFTFGLYPVTVAGAADALAYTAGTIVSGSSTAVATPSPSTVTAANSGDFTIPSDGAYTVCVTTSGTLANNNHSAMHFQLQTRWV